MHQGERGRESNEVAGEEGDFVLNIGDADAGDTSLAELVAVAVVYGVGLAGGDAVDSGIEAALTEVEVAAGHTGADLVGDVGDGLETAAGTAAGLGEDPVVLDREQIAAFDTSGAGVVLGNVYHAVADAQPRVLQPVPGGGVRVVELLGEGAAAHAVVSADIDDRCIPVRYDEDVVGLAANGDDVLHVGRNPLAG